jgi:uncharacterized membrane protein
VERCPQCERPLPEQAQYCSNCGTSLVPAGLEIDSVGAAVATLENRQSFGSTSRNADAPGEPLPLPENIAGVIAYITILPAIFFLLAEPFKRNRFVRFHSVQHLLLWVAGFAVGIAAGILGAVLQLIPFMRVLVFPLAGLISLAWFFLWVLLLIKAYNHEVFKLPILGDLAETWANR